MLWLNAFEVQPGAETITSLSIVWSDDLPPFTPTTLLLYRDPTGDGDPTDALLLLTVNIASLPDLGHEFRRVDIEPTFVGSAGGTFFVGALVTHESGEFPAAADTSSPSAMASWWSAAPAGSIDVENLAGNPFPPLLYDDTCPACGGNWMLRADATHPGGIPCQPGDVNGDGLVDVLDLVQVIVSWGPCPAPPQLCPADVDGSGAVDVLDLVLLIVNWS